MIDFNQKIRKEKYNQFSGYINYSQIEVLKNKNFLIIDMPLDGEAPKQYIKAYFYKSNTNIRKSNCKTWSEYFAKFGSKSYPNESVIEYVMNKLGESLGISINETELVLVNGQIRFLSKNFLRKGQKLIHGIEIISEYFQDEQFIKQIDRNKKERRKYLTFELIEKSIKHVYPKGYHEIITSFIQLITFDAIIGNNDRHHYNWGLIGDVEKIKNRQPFFAPIYDTARGLLWNSTDEYVRKMYKQHKNGSRNVYGYIEKSKPRVSFENNDSANHFELIKYLSAYNEEYRNIILSMIEENREQKMNNLFIFERSELIKEILRLRFDKLRKLIS
jgi:hypothetical protein